MIEIKNVSKWYGSFQVLTDCTTATNRYISTTRLSRCATLLAAPTKSVTLSSETSETSWNRMMVCVSSTGSMLRKACGRTTSCVVWR